MKKKVFTSMAPFMHYFLFTAEWVTVTSRSLAEINESESEITVMTGIMSTLQWILLNS